MIELSKHGRKKRFEIKCDECGDVLTVEADVPDSLFYDFCMMASDIAKKNDWHGFVRINKTTFEAVRFVRCSKCNKKRIEEVTT